MLKILNRDLLSNPMYVINNLHIYDWESDFLAITRSLYAYEVEVKERGKGVRAGAEAVRKPAWDAFRAQCPHIAFPYGKEFPMCDDHEQDHPMRDCILQCEKGRIFKSRLK